MKTKDKAIETLKALIAAHRARIDPALLERVRHAAENGPHGATLSDTVPYDRAAAEQAVKLFLADHPAQEDFTARLLEKMKKSAH